MLLSCARLTSRKHELSLKRHLNPIFRTHGPHMSYLVQTTKFKCKCTKWKSAKARDGSFYQSNGFVARRIESCCA